MRKNILVTTDLSVNSKSGIRFGLQLARQSGSTLTFYHALQIDKPTRWSDSQFDAYVSDEIAKAENNLKTFINRTCKDDSIAPRNYQLVVQKVSSIQQGIIDYAVSGKADFICISTRGAGKVSRILGTNTSYIIKHSPIPVLAIPKNYRTAIIDHILYATDLNGLAAELSAVRKFAAVVASGVSVVHYDYLSQVEDSRKKFNKIVSRYQKPGLKFYLEKLNVESSLGTHLKKAVRKFNPSLVILFTQQNRDWFERLFLPSNSAEVSYDSKKPLLIFSKKK